ncbi:molybdopterin molybdotransferase MoeA [Defluviimonas sp. WL0002]|uniref:Molybdopterin molybdenumtransferase n=1 Tax=Albidovulum marisflavi TaxID=2984159 RepID=A0ABT2ZBW9_9RHOB|nr:gephyrin-like molybdotransferase Glp [Defluviimonas sp. WL0002]MCV2868578.1 molybdopterin molybdotransferase MoeA [Defluviimonas sp. WL0002]
MIQVQEALERVLSLVNPTGIESVPLRQAAGRVLAEPVSARLTQPPFAASAMDGYAIREGDHHAGRVLTVIGEAAAGRGYYGTISAGQAVRIFTGAPVPEGGERVVLQEDVAREGDRITLGPRLEEGRHIRAAGQDFAAGDRIDAPRRIGHKDIALLAAMNVPEVSVRRRPVVAFLSTGDELVMPGEEPGPDQIVASNALALAALAEAEGAEARVLPIAKDTVASLRFALSLAEDADMIVTIGGASVGDHDLVGKVLAELGMEQAFWKIAMRPGKPLLAGRLGNTAIIGLPGNPVSSVVCGHIFMAPAIRAMLGLRDPAPVPMRATLAERVDPNGPRAHYMRAVVTPRDGMPEIRALPRQDSALLSVLAQANALLIRPVGDPARASGETVDYIPI